MPPNTDFYTGDEWKIMPSKTKDILNIIRVICSNFMLFLSGVATSFLLPKILPQDEYGLYKIFNLYVTYIIVLQFGIVEGIYIKYGGKSIDEIDSREFSGYVKALTMFQTIVGIIIAVCSLIFLRGDYKFIFFALAFDVVIVNITNLYQYLSQAVQRFSELSRRNILKAVLTVIGVLGAWCVGLKYSVSYKAIVILVIAINFILLMLYFYSYRNITFKKTAINKTVIFEMMKSGFPLCLANIISTLILAMDRQVVSLFFTTAEYALYAFAYSMLTLVLTVVSSISIVLFSVYKKKAKDKLLNEYNQNVGLISILVSLMGLVFFPLVIIIDKFLPVYHESLSIFRIIIPGLMISSPISIVMHNYYKSLDENMAFFKRSVFILILSLAANIFAYYAFGTMYAISYASVIVMIIWYLTTEYYLRKNYGINSVKSLLYILVMSVIFYGCSMFENFILAIGLYLLTWLVITVVLFKNEIIDMFSVMIKKKDSNG